MNVLDKMVITAIKNDVLETLRKNLGTHTAIVKEARVGYMTAARKMLEKKLKELETAGKPIAMYLHLDLPQDHSKVYETAIKMLEMHQGDTIELDAGQVRNLVMDDWDWKGQFLGTNSAYSATAAGMRGNDGEDN